jgi:arylsulfatase A-like enzyme
MVRPRPAGIDPVFVSSGSETAAAGGCEGYHPRTASVPSLHRCRRLPLLRPAPMFSSTATPSPRESTPSAHWGLRAGLLLVLATSGCGGSTESDRPNILWVVWDTARADRMSLYGHERRTTPFLEEWAEGALVFDDCASTACSTVPSHAGMFTGKLPSEHGTRFGHSWLDDQHETIAEILKGAGYDTYLWAANPHVSKEENFHQGFDTVQHPWDPETLQRALAIVHEKVKGDQSSELPENLRSGRGNQWMIKAAGELAQERLGEWLAQRDDERPFFAFVNYMEAHRPMIPPRELRAQMMSPEQVDRSYLVDRSWVPMWAYCFGLHEYSPEELEVMARTYDATLLELDGLLRSLLASLEAGGHLEDTIIVLTSDHGEHLGEHHMMDHQFTLYEGLIRVPLVLHAPGRVQPGRSSATVANYDLFPTLLELADVAPPADLESAAVSLLEPREERVLLSELPSTFSEPFREIEDTYPNFEAQSWERTLVAYRRGSYKLIWSSLGDHELYDLSRDPREEHDIFAAEEARAQRLLEGLSEFAAGMQAPPAGSGPRRGPSPEHLERLRALGYVAGDGEQDRDGGD